LSKNKMVASSRMSHHRGRTALSDFERRNTKSGKTKSRLSHPPNQQICLCKHLTLVRSLAAELLEVA